MTEPKPKVPGITGRPFASDRLVVSRTVRHSYCSHCWTAANGSKRQPVDTLRDALPPVETCCKCGVQHRCGIYVMLAAGTNPQYCTHDQFKGAGSSR